MIKINLNPVGPTDANQVYPQHEVSWFAPVLTVDTIAYDLSLLGDGATAQHPVLGAVSRVGNDYECTIKLMHGANAPHGTRFPDPIEVTEDGPVTLPPYGGES